MNDKQKLRLIQEVLFDNTSYDGHTNGEVDDEDLALVQKLIDCPTSLTGDCADTVILALLACGYNNNLVDDGIAGDEFVFALRKVFDIPEPEPKLSEPEPAPETADEE